MQIVCHPFLCLVKLAVKHNLNDCNNQLEKETPPPLFASLSSSLFPKHQALTIPIFEAMAEPQSVSVSTGGYPAGAAPVGAYPPGTYSVQGYPAGYPVAQGYPPQGYPPQGYAMPVSPPVQTTTIITTQGQAPQGDSMSGAGWVFWCGFICFILGIVLCETGIGGILVTLAMLVWVIGGPIFLCKSKGSDGYAWVSSIFGGILAVIHLIVLLLVGGVIALYAIGVGMMFV